MSKKTSILLLFFLLASIFDNLAQSWDDAPANIKSKKFFKRLEYFYRQREAPNDSIPVYKYFAQMESEILKKHAVGQTDEIPWTSVGPTGIISSFPQAWGVMSGRIRAIAVDPIDPNIVYIGSASGGLRKTTNGGQSWQYLSNDFMAISFGAIAIDPNNRNVVYAGTGEVRYGQTKDVYQGHGMYKSTDAGATWKNITSGFGFQTFFSQIVVNPQNSNIVLASLGAGNWFTGSTSNRGIWKSTDAGNTFERVLDFIPAFDLAFQPGSADVVFAAAEGGFFKSTNSGDTWVQMNNGLSAAEPIKRMQISVSKQSPNTIYAVIYSSSTLAYKTTNGGTSWTQISENVNLGGTYNGTTWSDQGGYDLAIAVNPSDGNHVLIGNVEIHKATDGTNFSPVRIPGGIGAWDSPMHVDYHQIVFAPSNSNIIYIGCDGGIYKTTDGGVNFFDCNKGINTIQINRLANSPFSENTIIAGAQDNGIFATYNKGATDWSLVSTGDGMELGFDWSDSTIAYGATQYGNLSRAVNGASFQNISPPYEGQPAWIAAFCIHPANHDWIYICSKKVWRSTNSGDNWTALTGILTSDNINTMAISKVNPLKMILAGSGSYTSDPDIMISTNGGTNWLNVASNIPGSDRYVVRVQTDPYNENTMYVVRTGFGSGKIYKTTDLGLTWQNISGDLPDIPTSALFIDPEIPGNFYVGNDFGVYRSIDNGISWNRMQSGIPFVPVMDFSYTKYGTKRILRAGTYGASAYQLILHNTGSNYVDLLAPNGTENWVIGNMHEIKWQVSPTIDSLEIDFSIDGGNTWTVITNSTSALTGKFSWAPVSASTQARIRIKAKNFPSLIDISSHNFTISSSTAVRDDLKGVPKDFVLQQNFPNPFPQDGSQNTSTAFRYGVPEFSSVKLTIYDISGAIIHTFSPANKDAGYYEEVWNASNVASGIYFLKMEADGAISRRHYEKSIKLILKK